MKSFTYENPVRFVDVLGVRIRCMKTAQVLETFKRFMRDPKPRSVYIVNAATANFAYQNTSYRACLNRGDLVLNDGTGVRWAARLKGMRLEANHVGTDLIPRLCDDCKSWGMRTYLLGGQPGVSQGAAQVLSARFPGLHLVGHHHGYLEAWQEETLCEQINAARPHLLLVAMGNPLQELWIDRNLHRLVYGVAIGVGGFFDHLAGSIQRAPQWIRQMGFEWAHILIQQPHKWRRYLLGNPLFLYRMMLARTDSAVGIGGLTK